MSSIQSDSLRNRPDETITLMHGEGGRQSRALLKRIFSWLEQQELEDANDASWVDIGAGEIGAGDIAITTDSYVVTPLFFPGGDIGKLAICGTLNDLAVSGARPVALTLSLIIEEGVSLNVLERIVRSAAETCSQNGIRIACGDTKVVPSGACDGVFINTAGIGRRELQMPGPEALKVGDQIVITGPMGAHGLALMAAREGLQFSPPPISDVRSLWPTVKGLTEVPLEIRGMRDATRGGVAAVCHEWAAACGHTIELFPDDFPESDCLRGVAELLGLNPLHIANEGTMLIGVAEKDVSPLVERLRSIPGNHEAARIGEVVRGGIAPVLKRDLFGRGQAVDEPLGTPLPRIC
jgi:hydrogenase expression/formation protein HypE